MRRRDFIIRASGAALAFPLSVAAQPAEDGPVARTALGDMRGAWRDGIATFYGVPYAAPPVGELRFATAAPAVPWQGQRDAMRHGSIPPQLPARLSAVSGEPLARPQGEDCLTLTICTPAADAKARPVIVWLHGGAWLSGAGPDQLVREEFLHLIDFHLFQRGHALPIQVDYQLGISRHGETPQLHPDRALCVRSYVLGPRRCAAEVQAPAISSAQSDHAVKRATTRELQSAPSATVAQGANVLLSGNDFRAGRPVQRHRYNS